MARVGGFWGSVLWVVYAGLQTVLGLVCFEIHVGLCNWCVYVPLYVFCLCVIASCW